jgi:hypothetical protein
VSRWVRVVRDDGRQQVPCRHMHDPSQYNRVSRHDVGGCV